MTLPQNFLRARNGAWRRPSGIRRVSRYSCLHCCASWYWPGIKAVWQKNASKPPALTPRSLPPPPREGKCMHIRPPPFSYTWDDYLEKKKLKFRDVPLSSIDLMNPCRGLGIPIKGIFVWSQKQHPLNHSPCIINSDDFGSRGTHRVCCWRSGEGEYEYLDSFGLSVPVEFETELLNKGQKAFLRNDNQIQWVGSVRCGYYCLLFLNERNKGKSSKNILKMFSDDLHENEPIVKN